MKIIKLLILFLFFSSSLLVAQEYDPERIRAIENNLSSLVVDISGLDEKIDVAIQNTTLSTFLLSISEIHRINIDVSEELNGVNIINNFKDVNVKDVLVYLCKNYNLELDITGTILYFKKFEPEPEEPKEIPAREIPVNFDASSGKITLDLQDDQLVDAFKKISEQSGNGLFFTEDLRNSTLSVFINDMPFDIAMEKLAFSNNLNLSKSFDGSFEFRSREGKPGGPPSEAITRPGRNRRSNFFFEVLDPENKRLNVDFENVSVADIIYDISNELKLDVFTATPLDDAGMATVKADNISFDFLLTKIFESSEGTGLGSSPNNGFGQGNPGTPVAGNQGLARAGRASSSSPNFTFKNEDNVYYFGTVQQITLRSSEVIPLVYRSIEMFSDPESTGRSVGRTVGFNQNFGGPAYNNQYDINNPSRNSFDENNRRNRVSNNEDISEGEGITDLIPEDIKKDLGITVDKELNSFIVSGPSLNVNRFREFVKTIDKPVPVIIIEVMILEISQFATLDVGVEWGLGSEPVATEGGVFPETNLTLGAETVNRILGRLDGLSFLNIGTVVPNFFANIKASEANGNVKIKSSPRIATLNGHRAYFSNGETSYYAVTNQTFIGVQNPATSEIRNYQPIDAELSLEAKPFVSQNGDITMDIKVIQSTFNGERIAEDAPPGLNSREFTSIIRARNNDIIVLGGLEEKSKNDGGSGVPFLARIPIIKWLFSKRLRTDKKSKLTVLIKPTIIY